MKVVAAVFADFVEAPAGGPAQLQTELAGQAIVVRTLRRLAQVPELAARYLVVRERDRAAAEGAVAQAGLAGTIAVWPHDPGIRPRHDLVRAARKWNLESWRSNPLGLTWFDEFVDPPTVARVLEHAAADAVFCFGGHQPLLDPALANAMLAHLAGHADECKYVFTQAPPGLAGVIIRRTLLVDLLKLAIPLGLFLAYRPEIPQPDPITSPACCHVEPEIMQAATRLTGDTRRSRELLAAVLAALGEGAPARAVCEWTAQPENDRAGPLPIEVELELTTADPLPETTLRPRGSRVPRRRLDDLDAVARLAAELAAYDDRLVFLAGHGDPLQHPHFAEVCRTLRTGGVYGIGVATPLVDLTPPNFEALFEQQVDVVEVQLDAHSRETYQRVQQRDAFDQVVANVRRLEDARQQRRAAQPIVVCSQTRCAATLSELEAFHDHWISQTGSAVIHGYNDYCGLLPPDTLLPAWPPVREACRRLSRRLMLLADGRVALCGQDVRGEACLGDWRAQRLGTIWSGAELARARDAHASLKLDTYGQCRSCNEWARP